MSQEQIQPRSERAEEASFEPLVREPETADSSFEDLLDQIDAVIEKNPEGYVRSFVQRGGQ